MSLTPHESPNLTPYKDSGESIAEKQGNYTTELKKLWKMTGHGSSCGACKFLRRRCANNCIFAPYFSYEHAPSHFAAIHKVFGASNVSKLLSHIPVHSRSDAAMTISYEALARMHDPVYGCVAHIFALQQQIACLKEEMETIGNQMANFGEIQNTISSDPYLVAEFGIIENCSNEQSLPTIQHSEYALADEAWCSHMELQQYQDEISQCYFDSIILERLLEELDQDYNVHANLR